MENMELFVEYSPVIMLVLLCVMQFRIFVTPEILKKKHREIIAEVESRFTVIDSVIDLKEQISEIKEKIDKIYNYFLKNS